MEAINRVSADEQLPGWTNFMNGAYWFPAKRINAFQEPHWAKSPWKSSSVTKDEKGCF
ncbi:hypothetical protein J6590_093285 [Homalodisca vitripennis]|nr:hypothetical protein J6590_093285 [Homalodisca vitripennis]